GAQITYSGLGVILCIRPTAPLPLDPIGPTIVDSSFHMTTVYAPPEAMRAVQFVLDASANSSPRASITNNSFSFEEINGGQTGVHVDFPVGAEFASNRFQCMHVHFQRQGPDPVILIGNVPRGEANRIHRNIWT